jgi:hypothetical protein
MRLRRLWPFAAVAIGEILIALTIFGLGDWHGWMGRYDHCAFTRIGPQYVYVCPINDEPAPVRSVSDGEPA